ncbi:MAG: hypothetical protein JJE25_12555 [Bacteroidia bacterium]|nr:hypothetical protein [Bacteroidia bacterium]
MKRPWIFLINPILVATENSYRMAVRISTYHDSALLAASADPFFLALYNLYHPLHLQLVKDYDNWHTQMGLQEGESLNVNQLLRLESNTKIKQWDVAIQNVYAQGTPKYMSLLPNHRTPFQQGTQNDRIQAVHSLSNAIGTDLALAAVKADVDAFYTQINNALTAQKGAIAVTKTLSDAVDASRIAMCIQQYANLGSLINKYAAVPSDANQYFDEEGIRNAQQVMFTGHVKPQHTHTIVKHTFAAADNLKLENPGNTMLSFYLAQVKGAQPGATVITLNAGEQQTVPATALGNIANPYLVVFNPDAINKGEFVVEIV